MNDDEHRICRDGDEFADRTGLRIHVVGTGGQGVLLTAQLVTDFFASRGHQVLCSQGHGMAQRGGAVQSTVIIDCGDCPLMRRGDADFLLGLEPVETARALPCISSRTTVFMNTAPVLPFIFAQQHARGNLEAVYPHVDSLKQCIRAVTPHLFSLNATQAARQAGTVKSVNMVMLGCMFGSWRMKRFAKAFLATLTDLVPLKMARFNEQAFLKGFDFGATAVG